MKRTYYRIVYGYAGGQLATRYTTTSYQSVLEFTNNYIKHFDDTNKYYWVYKITETKFLGLMLKKEVTQIDYWSKF